MDNAANNDNCFCVLVVRPISPAGLRASRLLPDDDFPRFPVLRPHLSGEGEIVGNILYLRVGKNT